MLDLRTALTWTLHLLSNHENVQTKLRAELRTAFAEAQSRGQDVLIGDDLNALPYLDAVTVRFLGDVSD